MCIVCNIYEGVMMFSPEFMRYLINYQKQDFAPEKTEKEIKFNNPKKGKLAEIFIINK